MPKGNKERQFPKSTSERKGNREDVDEAEMRAANNVLSSRQTQGDAGEPPPITIPRPRVK